MTDPVTTVVPLDGTDVPVTWTAYGEGPAMLLLHGGGGPVTVESFAASYAEQHPAGVIVPTHPGFNGTPRPASLDSIAGIARVYAGLLDELDLADVTVVGNSIGGWLTAELAVLDSPRVGRYVIVDGVGLDLPDAPIADFFSLTMSQVADLSYYEPDRFRIDTSALPQAAQDVMAANRATLRLYGGTSMSDPTLLGRLSGAGSPSLVIWGAADRIVPPAHGEAYARELPDARYELIDTAGHLPQLETPDVLARLVSSFVAG